jgi:hypothetical protein
MSIQSPISYIDFLKNPVVGMLFMCLIAISYLYIDNRGVYTGVIEKQEKRITQLERSNQVKDSVIIVITTKISNLESKLAGDNQNNLNR